VFWNQRASELYGWSAQEAVGKPVNELFQAPFSEQREDIESKLLRNGVWEGELAQTRRDGRRIDVASRWVLRRDISGEPRDILQLNHDLTILKQAEQRARESEQMALLGTMAAIFAHEVANPLTGISSSLQLAERQIKTERLDFPSLVSILQDATKEVFRLASLLAEFRAGALPQILDPKPTDLMKNIEEVLACELPAYRALGITVQLKFDNPLPPVLGEAEKIKQVILNLCKNAVEAMPGGGSLTLKGYQSEQMVVVEISDTGIGIPDDLDVFKPFKTTKPHGTGLGLWVARQIISSHNGAIAYTSKRAHGTTFEVSLPAIQRTPVILDPTKSN
jgi:PAS domain S-box-containing protein